MGHRFPDLGDLTAELLYRADAAVTSSLVGGTDTTPVFVGGSRGDAILILAAGKATAGTGPTLDVNLQHCDTVDGSFVDVTGAAFDTITDADDVLQAIVIKPGRLKDYVAINAVVAGSMASWPSLSVTMLHQ